MSRPAIKQPAKRGILREFDVTTIFGRTRGGPIACATIHPVMPTRLPKTHTPPRALPTTTVEHLRRGYRRSAIRSDGGASVAIGVHALEEIDRCLIVNVHRSLLAVGYDIFAGEQCPRGTASDHCTAGVCALLGGSCTRSTQLHAGHVTADGCRAAAAAVVATTDRG